MTAEDWILGAFLSPIFLIAVWIVTIRVWRAGATVDDRVGRHAAGEYAQPGYYGYLAPGAVGCTALWVGAMLELARTHGEWAPGWANSR